MYLIGNQKWVTEVGCLHLLVDGGGQSLIVVMVDGIGIVSIRLSMGVVIDDGGGSLMVVGSC